MILPSTLTVSMLLSAALGLTPITSGAGGQFPIQAEDRTDFTSTQYVRSTVTLGPNGELAGRVTLWNEERFAFCAQAVFLVTDDAGRQITYTSGGGCVRGAFGRTGREWAIHKDFDVHARLDPVLVSGATRILISVVPDEKLEVTPEVVATLFRH
jgi:hypothetical protein